MKLLAFDLETSRIVPPDSDLRAHRPLGICAWAVAWQDEEIGICTRTGHEKDRGAQMTRSECQWLVTRLRFLTRRKGFSLVGVNLAGFDLDILAEESGMYAECAELALDAIDPCFHVHCLRGYPVGLDAMAKGFGLPGKMEGMSGSLAPIMWQQGQYDEVIDYVANDARATLQVAMEIERRGGLVWIAKSGRLNTLPVPKLLTVAECLALPEPDTSWMTSPIPRERFVAWMQKETQ